MNATNVVSSAAKPTSSENVFAGLSEKEALAGLRVLACIAMVEGKLGADERAAFESAFAGLKVPVGVTPKGLLEEKIDLDLQLRLFTTTESRELLYQSALGMVHADGESRPEEQKILERIRGTLQISEDKASLARRVFDEAKDTVLLSSIPLTKDPAQRTTEVKSDVTKYSVLSGALGSFPIPGLAIATDLAVVAMQIKLVRDIGQRYGHKVDKQAALSLLGGLGLGTGARIAVSNLAKLVPGWGSVVGGTSSFASTWALGKVADKYFSSGMSVPMATLQSEFKGAQGESRAAYDAHKDAVDSKRKMNLEALSALGADLKAKKITQQEYSTRVERLA